jgi:hypothetical protein
MGEEARLAATTLAVGWASRRPKRWQGVGGCCIGLGDEAALGS